MAQACDGRVEVLAERSETKQVFAEPDGRMVAELTAQPVRVRRPDASWVPVDTTLRATADGSVSPVAVPDSLALSGGGTSPLVRLTTGGRGVALGWPSALPAPVLSGDSATYPEVFPGVDLVVRALVDGFSHVLVVKTREAAASAAVREVRYRLSGVGVSVSRREDGTLAAVDDSGVAVVTSAPAVMWDSGVPDGQSGAARSAAAAGERSSAAGAGDGATTRPVGVQLSGDVLTLTPDRAMLTDPAVALPLFVDPSFSTGSARWAYANTTGAPRNDEFARVGRDPDGSGLYRSFFVFDLRPLRDKIVKRAQVSTVLFHSWSCVPTPVSLYQTGPVGSGFVGWPGPGLEAWRAERQGNAHKYPNACGPQPDQRMEFGGDINGNDPVTGAVRAMVGRDGPDITFGLLARRQDGSGEDTQAYWKKFWKKETKLSVEFNSIPNVPDRLDTANKGCKTGSDRPVVGTADAVLKARVKDPDGDGGGLLTARFIWQSRDPDAREWSKDRVIEQKHVAHDSTAQVTLRGLSHGGVYRWTARTLDKHGGESDRAKWCEFEVDTIAPEQPPVVSSEVYKDDLSKYHGAVGFTADFTFSANGVADVAGYKYGWADPPTTVVKAPAVGADVTRALTPPPPKLDDPTDGGQLTLYVSSVDRAGTPSARVAYTFLINSATGPVGLWAADEGTGTVLADASGNNRPAALQGRASWTAGHNGGSAVSLDGTSGHARTAGPVLATDRSFAVAAWVRLPRTDTGHVGSVVSQNGAQVSGFNVGYDGSRWMFSRHWQDKVDPDTTRLFADPKLSKKDVWTHVAAVYDAGTREVRLYVNGALADSAPFTAGFNARGSLDIGRARWNGQWTNFLPGAVSDVRAWDRVVSDAEMKKVAVASAATATAGQPR